MQDADICYEINRDDKIYELKILTYIRDEEVVKYQITFIILMASPIIATVSKSIKIHLADILT